MHEGQRAPALSNVSVTPFFDRVQNDTERVEVNLFELKSIVLRLARFAIDGNEPLKLLLLMLSQVKVSSPPIVVGIVPVKEFLLKSKVSRFLSNPIEAGNLPKRLF